MIKSNRNNIVCKIFAFFLERKLKRKFSTISVSEINLKENHSVILLMNHFSWWDGFLGGYLINNHLKKKFHIMMQEDHLANRKMLRLLGAYSIKKDSRESLISLKYSAQILEDPQNAILLFPQGELESMHTHKIHIEKGVEYIIKNCKSPCQIIYSATILDYYEGFKPQVRFELLDCGTNTDWNFENLKTIINSHHQSAIEKGLRIKK